MNITAGTPESRLDRATCNKHMLPEMLGRHRRSSGLSMNLMISLKKIISHSVKRVFLPSLFSLHYDFVFVLFLVDI